jgi:hypothetical protein
MFHNEHRADDLIVGCARGVESHDCGHKTNYCAGKAANIGKESKYLVDDSRCVALVLAELQI